MDVSGNVSMQLVIPILLFLLRIVGNLTKMDSIMIDSLASHVDLKGRNLFLRCTLTSIKLAEWLLEENKFPCIGTLQHNQNGIPIDTKTAKHRDVLSSEIYWEKENNVTNYILICSQDINGKTVLILSTHEPILGVTKDDGKKKPKLYKVYDFAKEETDILDQRMGFYTTKTKCRRWNITEFSCSRHSSCECINNFCHEQ